MNTNQKDAIIMALSCVLEALKAINSHNIILQKLEEILMNDQEAQAKMNEIVASNAVIVAAVTDVSADLVEATAEINARIVELQATIDELMLAAPGLSPELQALIESASAQTAATAASMSPLQAASQVLADVVPNAPVV